MTAQRPTETRHASGRARTRGSLAPSPSLPLPGAASRLLPILLAALLVARAAFAFVPSTWGWGLDALRFVPPLAGWALWSVAALALLPAVSRRVAPAVSRMTGEARGPGWRTYLAWSLLAAAVVVLLPDQVLFVGDARLRRDMLNAPGGGFGALNPQALPLDGWIHDTLVRGCMRLPGASATGVGRALGAIEAAMMGALAVRLARVLGLRGGAALAASAVFLCTGALALFTGYGKSFSELSLVGAAVGVFGLDAVRSGRGLLPMGVALALGLLVHRLALALVPAAIVAWVFAWRAAAGAPKRITPARVIALAIPLAALALSAPGLLRLAAGFDPVNFRPPEVSRAGGVLAAAFRATQLADSANMILLMAPLAPLVLLAPFVLVRPGQRREFTLLAALALPLAGFLPFFHPPIGLFRNWDAFAPAGVAVSLAAAWCVGLLLADGGRGAPSGGVVALQAAVPALLWLLHQHDVGRGLARVEAYLREPPARSDIERASAWDFLGARYVDLGRTDESADAFSRAAAITPSPRILREWAALETLRGDRQAAREILRTLLERKPDEVRAWMESAKLAWQLGDTTDARRCAGEALRRSPGLVPARRLIEFIDRHRGPGSGEPAIQEAP